MSTPNRAATPAARTSAPLGGPAGYRTAPRRPAGERRVVVTDSPAWGSPLAVRAALAQAWGDGQAVLVTRPRRGPSDRMAERIWRSWGGQVQAHPHRWDVHHGRHEHRDQAGRRLGSNDLTVSFRGGGNRLVDHHIAAGDYAAAVTRAQRSVTELREHPDTDQAEHARHHSDHDSDRDSDQDADGRGPDAAGDERGDQR